MNALIIIKALEDGVSVIFTGDESGETPAPERLDHGEVLIIAAPQKRDGIHVRGHAEVYTSDHIVAAESALLIGGRPEDTPPSGQ